MRVAIAASRGQPSRRGSFLVVVVVMLTFLMGLTMAFFTVANSGHREITSTGDRLRARYLAEAAVHEGIAAYALGGQAAVDALNANGALSGASYQTSVTWGAAGGTVGVDLVVMQGTATVGRQSITIELVARQAASSELVMGFAAKNDLVMNSNSMVDSYDSSLGTYASQLTGKWKGIDIALPNAPVSTNGDISMDSNSSIMGDAHPGVGGTLSLSGGCKVDGATTPLVTPLSFVSITMPSITKSGSIKLSKGSKTLPAGDHGYKKLEMDSNGTLTLTGPANYLFGSMKIDSNSRIFIDATNGPVNVYVTGTYEQNSNTVFEPTSGDPSDLTLFIKGKSPDVLFDSNASFTGVLYAPDRDVTVKSNSAIYGALAAKSIEADSNAEFHFDENLLAGGAGGDALEVMCWRIVATP